MKIRIECGPTLAVRTRKNPRRPAFAIGISPAFGLAFIQFGDHVFWLWR